MELLTATKTGLTPADLATADARSVEGRPWVMANFVASIDGATAVEGGSTALGDSEDAAVFAALRDVSDAILVGATTVIVEDYRPVSLDADRRAVRAARGQRPTPKLAIVTGTMSLDVEQRVFSDSEFKPLVITGPYANPGRLAMLGDAADVKVLADITPATILDSLSEYDVVLLEGGPSLAGQFATAGLLDEFNLTVAPELVGGDSARIAGKSEIKPAVGMRLERVVAGKKMLFLRYLKPPH